MATAVWTVLAVLAMGAIFGCCVLAVVVAVRLYENHRERRRTRMTA